MTMINMKRRMEQLEADSPDNVPSFRIVFRDERDPEVYGLADAPGEQLIVTTFVAAENEWIGRLSDADPAVNASAWAHLEQIAQSFNPADSATDVRTTAWTPIERIAWAYRFDPARYPFFSKRADRHR